MKRPSGDHVGSNSGQGDRVSRLSPVPSALMDQTSWTLSKTMRPESDESEMDPPPLLGPDASEDRATGGAPGPLLHAPAARITAMEVVRMRPNLMPLCTLRAAGRFPDAAQIRPSHLRVMGKVVDAASERSRRPSAQARGHQ